MNKEKKPEDRRRVKLMLFLTPELNKELADAFNEAKLTDLRLSKNDFRCAKLRAGLKISRGRE